MSQPALFVAQIYSPAASVQSLLEGGMGRFFWIEGECVFTNIFLFQNLELLLQLLHDNINSYIDRLSRLLFRATSLHVYIIPGDHWGKEKRTGILIPISIFYLSSNGVKDSLDSASYRNVLERVAQCQLNSRPYTLPPKHELHVNLS